MQNKQILLDAFTVYKKLSKHLLHSIGAMYYHHSYMYDVGDYQIFYKSTETETTIQITNTALDRMILCIENIINHHHHQIIYYDDSYEYSSGEIIDVWLNYNFDIEQKIVSSSGHRSDNFFLTEEERFQKSCVDDNDYLYISEFYNLVKENLPNLTRCVIYGEFICNELGEKIEFKGIDYETL